MATTLIATSDFHSSVPTGRGTLTAIATARRAGALVVDAGDFFGGNAFHEWSQGRVEENILGQLYDAVVPGNHDLADLMRLRRPQAFPPVVCCNLAPPAGFAGRWETGILLPARGLRIGLVGFIGAQAFAAVPTGERSGFTFTEPDPELLRTQADRLLARGADIVVGVSHSGFDHDVDLQRRTSPFPIIIAGHCHSERYHWAADGRHVVKGPEIGAGLLRIDLHRGGGHHFTVENHPEQQDISRPPGADGALIDTLTTAIAEYTDWSNELLGHTTGPLPERDVLAPVVAEQARLAAGADAFVLNLFTLRRGLPAQVTRQALADAAPFDAGLVRLTAALPLSEVVAQAQALGEQPVVAAAGARSTIATTAYLADRLGLPAEPIHPPRTVRSTITSLLRRPA